MRTFNLFAAGAMALCLAGVSSAALAGPVTSSQWAAVNDDGGLGGSFVYLNSGGQNPLTVDSDWTVDWSPDDVVFDATFGSAQYTNQGSWGSDFIFSFGAPDTTTYGERFFAPGGNLTSFNFLILNNSGRGGGCDENCGVALGPVDATFVVARFNGSRSVGPALYSQSVIIPVSNDYAWTNIGGFDLALQTGEQYVAFLTVAGITAVPEPATWALMIGGFGMAGAALRRRRMALARV